MVKFRAPSVPTVNQWAAAINFACEGTSVPPCLLAAIVSRESGGRNIYQEGMPAGANCGVGLCQITYGVDWSTPRPTYDGLDLLTPSSNLHIAVYSFLTELVADAEAAQRSTPASFQAACRGQIVFAAAAGYNAGWAKVELALSNSVDADQYTTAGYAADVLGKYEAFVEESHRA